MTKRTRAADLRLRREFHITLDEYNKIVAYQGNRCAICMKVRQPGKPRFATDHDHTTGLIRGAVCYWCNKLLGMFRDNSAKLHAAAEYLMFPPSIEALDEHRYTVPGKVGTKKRAKILKSLQERDGRFKSYTSPIRGK